MFAPQLYTDIRRNAEQVAAAREHTGLATGAQICEALREIRKTLDVLDGVHADLLACLESTGGYADEGASSTTSWAKRELRMTPEEAGKHRHAFA